MNTANYSDLLPYFCGGSNLDAIKTASALNQTDKSWFKSTSKDLFWENLLKRIGEKTGSKDKNHELVKYRFYVLTHWMRNTPIMTHDLVNARSFINHPCSVKSQLCLISIAAKMYIYSPLNDQKNPPPFDGSSIFTTESKKLSTCTAYSDEYLIINKDNSNALIYKNKKLLTTFQFNGLILQLEILHDHLFVRGTSQNGHVLSIIDLKDLKITTQEIAIPIQLSPLVITKAFFGESHIVITCIDNFNTSLIAASYKDLLNEPSQKSPWMELTLTDKFLLFEKNDRFIGVKFTKNRALDIGEITCSNDHLNYQLIESGITILQSSFGFYSSMHCIQERIFAAYNDQETNYICTYDIQSKKMTHHKLPDGPGFFTTVTIPTFIATSPLKVYYLTFPFENGAYNLQKISIFGFDYESQSHLSQGNSGRPK